MVMQLYLDSDWLTETKNRAKEWKEKQLTDPAGWTVFASRLSRFGHVLLIRPEKDFRYQKRNEKNYSVFTALTASTLM